MDSKDTAAPASQDTTGASSGSGSEPIAEPGTAAGWLTRNLTTLVIVVLGAVVLGYFLKGSADPVDDLVNIAKVVLALGLVIFIHELGHFLAAKWCGVYVQTFSIGFGGPFLGFCSAKWGETTYKIGWIPLGGYVKMMGEGEENEENADDPRSYKNKKVWQRMVIISAGVVMNMFLALVCYLFVYMTHGEDRNPGVVGSVGPGGPAWKKGLRPGAFIREIGDRQNPYYDELQRVVMRSGKEKPVHIVYDTYDTAGIVKHFDTEITPARGDDILAPMLLVRSASVPVFIRKIGNIKAPVLPHSPAASADPPLDFGDRVIAATDPDHRDQVTPLRQDPRHPDSKSLDFYDLEDRLQRLMGRKIVLRVQRAGTPTPIDVTVPPAFSRTLGVRMLMGPVVAIRENSPAAEAGLKEGKEAGDILDSVEVTDRDGKPLRFTVEPAKNSADIPLDPMRLPTQLAQWAERKPPKWDVKLTVWRQGKHKKEKEVLSAKWDPRWERLDKGPWAPEFPVSIAPLGLAYMVQTKVAGIDSDSPASATDLKATDEVKSIGFTIEASPGKPITTSRDLKGDDWAYYFTFFQSEADGDRVTEVTLTLSDGRKVTLAPRDDPTWPLVERGLIFDAEKRTMKADGVVEALTMSADRVATKMATIYENLLGMVRGKLSVRAISGPITIAKHSFDLAGRDTFEFILFIALININLAVVNFLPIPVLDGGHMVFLGYEALRGKPPSERWRFILTIMGLVVVLALMLFGLALDFGRHLLDPLKRMLGL